MSLLRFLHRNKWNRERRAEIDSYLRIETDQNLARGMPPEEARAAARRKFGNSTLIREEIYRMNTLGLLDALGRDLRYALRGMRHSPAFTAIAVFTLALGIGANTAIFTVVNSVLIKPLPFSGSDSLVSVSHSAAGGMNNVSLSAQMWATYAENNRTFQDFGVWYNQTVSVTGRGDPEQARAFVVSHGVLPALGMRPHLGRWFSMEDDIPGTPETAILAHGYWLRKFAGDPSAVGRVLAIDSRPRTVIGVMPAEFHLPGDLEVILPQRIDRARLLPTFQYQGLARLKPGVTIAQANADVARMLPMWIEKFRLNVFRNLRITPALRPLKEEIVGNVGQTLWVLMAAIGTVLLIACANVANLLLVRAAARRQELAIRAALGAGWRRIARELFVESLALAILGGAVGTGLAYGGLRLLVAMGPTNLPRLTEIAIDQTALSFALALSFVSALFFGIIPILKHAGPRIAKTLYSGRSISQTRERRRSQNALVTMQVALALLLLVGAGLMIRSFQALRGVQPGFAGPERIQTVSIWIPPAEVAEPERVTRMQHEILQKIAAIPVVASAAFTTRLPMDMSRQASGPINAEGKPNDSQAPPPIRQIKFISPGLFQAQGTPLVTGRDFTWTDIYDQREVAIVSENMAREVWGSAMAALGQRIREGNAGAFREIVGVAGDVYDNGADQRPPATVYWPARLQAQSFGIPMYLPRTVSFVIRSNRAGTEELVGRIREAVWSVNRNLPLAQVRTMAEIRDESMARTSFTLVMLGIAGAVALLLSVAGLYGVISYAVLQRRREIGIRLALGAQPAELKRAFVRQGLTLALIGVAIGLAASAVLTRSITSLLYKISPLDPTTYVLGSLLLLAVAVFAGYGPARRASRVDPVEALRAE